MLIKAINRVIVWRRALFALPFTASGALLPFAMGENPVLTLLQWLCIGVAFFAARSSGMAFNALIDRAIDAKNPRTAGRPLPQGDVKPLTIQLIAWGSLALFIVTCAGINRMTLYTAPFAALLIWGYSYTKRFLALCHVVLGAVQFFGPVMAYMALTGSISLSAVMLGLVALCSFAASDILYATQDLAFDQSVGLYSLPARLGLQRSLWVARLLHALLCLSLVMVALSSELAWPFYVAPLLLAPVLLIYHRSSPERAFTACNTAASFVTLFALLGAFAWRVSSLG